ncbi:MAG: M20/M25/M40 family metallo-hydrolase [Firmicutes bacterium]|nr:M20/M25/M40 family metallo-hydrolase [Bacillota bacterium]
MWFDLVKQLTELPGPVGYEDRVNQFLLERWKPHVQEIKIDGVGNLIAHKGGRGPRLLLTAHADEICFVVKSVSEDGFLWITYGQADMASRPTRSIAMNMAGQPCLVLGDDEPVEGIIATVSGHVMTPAQREKAGFDWNDFFIDIGAKSREEVLAKGIHPGAKVIWNPKTRRIGEYITGKAMDDRAGLAVLDRLIREGNPEDFKYDVYVISTVQEEIGLVGAGSFTKDDFDLAISLEIGLAGDIPPVDERDMPAKLGQGPTLVHKDFGVSYDQKLTRKLQELAGEAGIPIQHAVMSSFGTDGIALTQHGIPTAVVAFPTRYTHSPFETLAESDLEDTYRLISKFVTSE